jgi:hypothetical protein
MDDSARIKSLRLALAAASWGTSTAEVNEVLHDIGPSRGALTAVALELAGMLDEVAGRRWIEAELAAELGYSTH